MDNANPFAIAAQTIGIHSALRLALAVKTAHQETDVWAVCRALDNLFPGPGGGGFHGSMLTGSAFHEFINSYDATIDELSTLRNHAHAYWDANHAAMGV